MDVNRPESHKLQPARKLMGMIDVLAGQLVESAEVLDNGFEPGSDVGLVVGAHRLYHRQVICIRKSLGDSFVNLYHRPDDVDFSLKKRLDGLHGGKACTKAEVHQAGFHKIVEVMTHGNQFDIVLLTVVE